MNPTIYILYSSHSNFKKRKNKTISNLNFFNKYKFYIILLIIDNDIFDNCNLERMLFLQTNYFLWKFYEKFSCKSHI